MKKLTQVQKAIALPLIGEVWGWLFFVAAILANQLQNNLSYGTQYPTYQAHMVELDSEWRPPALVAELAWRRDQPLGPAAQWLAERFAVHLRAIG